MNITWLAAGVKRSDYEHGEMVEEDEKGDNEANANAATHVHAAAPQGNEALLYRAREGAGPARAHERVRATHVIVRHG